MVQARLLVQIKGGLQDETRREGEKSNKGDQIQPPSLRQGERERERYGETNREIKFNLIETRGESERKRGRKQTRRSNSTSLIETRREREMEKQTGRSNSTSLKQGEKRECEREGENKQGDQIQPH
eukprot:903514-Amorphochlora_amoeboformis.AAC.1